MLPLTELGNRLKEARLTKGLSLDDLQTITKIQKRYLIGIEEGNYDVMPGKFYVRAFIKQYAEAVQLDPEELFDQYKDDIPTIRNEELPEQLSRVKSRKTITESNPKVFAVLPTLLVVVFVVGALGLLYYFLQNNADDDALEPVDKEKAPINVVDDLKDKEKEEVPVEEEEKEPVEEPAKEETPKQELTVVEGKGAKSTYELKNAAKFELKVVTTGETWIQIKNGKGFSFFQGMLKKGATESQTFDLSKETEAIIVVGRTNDTEIYVNGQKLEYAVPPTEVVRQDITVRFVPPTQ
ncbi:helix-turn-helix domain-containing protein [Bacillus sp. cl95]|uniref:helix-turn-helix domain-containing protein n=1 Tax=unclassified Bacillus (in: firmicutes) TaxID=185979 RepID=UPI0034A51B81